MAGQKKLYASIIIIAIIVIVLSIVFWNIQKQTDLGIQRDDATCISDKNSLCLAVIENKISLCNEITLKEEQEECTRKVSMFWAIENKDSSLCNSLSSKVKWFCKALVEGPEPCNRLSGIDQTECVYLSSENSCSNVRTEKQEDCKFFLGAKLAISTNNIDACNIMLTVQGQNLCKGFITGDTGVCSNVTSICTTPQI